MYRFIEGKVSSPEDLRRREIYRGVARRLAEWHASLPVSAVTHGTGVNGHINGGVTREKRLSRMRIRRESIGEESGDCCGDGEGIFEMDEEEPKWVRELKMKELCMVEGWKGRVKRGLFKVFGRKWKVGERVEKDFEIVFEEDDGDEDDEEETRMACAWDEIFGEVDLESDRWTLP